jgi:hypothetical protein
MDKLRSDSALQVELIKRALKRIEEFRPERSLQAYVSMFNEITGLSKPISDNSLSGRRTLP